MRIRITFEVDPADDPDMWDNSHDTGMSPWGRSTLLESLEDMIGPAIKVEKL